MESKFVFGMLMEILLTALQITAWVMGLDGLYFASIIGLMGTIGGVLVGFKLGVDTTKLNEIEGKTP